MDSRPRRRRASLADVAIAAGTSKPIASRILNADPTLSVGAELRGRVLAAAKALGYRPHAAARGLRRSETGALGMLVPTLTNPVYAHIVRGAFQRAAAHEFTVLFAEDMDEQEAGETFARLVLAGRIDGLLVASARTGHPLLPLLAEYHVPHVFLNRAVPGSGRNVVMDDELAAAAAVDHLAGLGHRRIAHVSGPADVDPAVRRARGFLERAVELGLEPGPVVEVDFLEAGGAEALERLLELDGGVTAVYASTVSQATGILNRAWRLGLRVPDDLSVIAHAEMPLADYLVPPLTTVHMPLGELGAAGVDALVDQIAGGATRDVVVTTPPTVVVRASTASPAAAEPAAAELALDAAFPGGR